MNIYDMQHDTAAAQQIIKALALPALSRASEPPRPMPLSHLPRLPRETSMLYTIGRVDRSGRVANRGITDAVRWQPGDRLAMTLTPSAVVFCPAPDGLLRVPPRPCIAIPVTARRLLSITPGDELLLAAAPEYRIVIMHTMRRRRLPGSGKDHTMTSPEDPAACPPETVGPSPSASDKLISHDYIRNLFKLGRTAAYELTHRPGFPDPVEISPHCYRWWASEVDEFAATLRRERAQVRTRQAKTSHLPDPATPPRRITGKVHAVRTRKGTS